MYVHTVRRNTKHKYNKYTTQFDHITLLKHFNSFWFRRLKKFKGCAKHLHLPLFLKEPSLINSKYHSIVLRREEVKTGIPPAYCGHFIDPFSMDIYREAGGFGGWEGGPAVGITMSKPHHGSLMPVEMVWLRARSGQKVFVIVGSNQPGLGLYLWVNRLGP